MIATVWDVANEHLISFGVGAVVGFVLSDRYRLVRRNGKVGEGDGQLRRSD